MRADGIIFESGGETPPFLIRNIFVAPRSEQSALEITTPLILFSTLSLAMIQWLQRRADATS
ncbi:hypothetical protein [Pararhizobium sp. A13]|uniref:hypothetical protein n=1 Tax=Pararhizobium sp. A13 TaxID=3133975 RepID=UPI00324EFC33